MIDVFREVRERVSAEDAARHYGLEVDGKGWAVCPFHQDKNPSLHFRTGCFHCFGCGAGGSSIDFAAKYLNLTLLEAVERLNTDFALGLPVGKKPTSGEVEEAKRMKKVRAQLETFEAWRQWALNRLGDDIRTANQACAHIDDPDELDRLDDYTSWCITNQAQREYLAAVLSEGTMMEMAAIYKERGDLGLEKNQQQ